MLWVYGKDYCLVTTRTHSSVCTTVCVVHGGWKVDYRCTSVVFTLTPHTGTLVIVASLQLHHPSS
jgi:hypothetical protein